MSNVNKMKLHSGELETSMEMVTFSEGTQFLLPIVPVYTLSHRKDYPSCNTQMAIRLLPFWTATGFLETNLRQKTRMLLSFLVLLDAWWRFSPLLTPENSRRNNLKMPPSKRESIYKVGPYQF